MKNVYRFYVESTREPKQLNPDKKQTLSIFCHTNVSL